MLLISKLLNVKVFRFLLVGGSATVLQFGLLLIFVEGNLLEKNLAAVISYLLSSIYNYFISYTFTFASTSKHSKTLPKFMFVSLSSLLINSGLFWFFSTYLQIYYLVAQIISTLLVLIWNFYMHNYWSFKKNEL